MPAQPAQITAALQSLQAGRMVILTDDVDRENEGDLIVAAEKVTAEHINFMAKNARGLICLALSDEQVDRLGLPPMTSRNQSTRQTAFTVSIEAASGVTTGISAHDRAHTIQVAIQPNVSPSDVISPGHIFPLRAHPAGLRERVGHTEGSVALAKLAGLLPAAVLCEIMNDDGTMARQKDLEIFGKKHGIPIVSIREIIAYQSQV